MQEDSTSDLIFSVAKIVSFLSQDTTLAPGTVILTGTPCGIGMSRDPPQYLAPGDEVIATVEGIGSLSSSVARAAQPLELMPGPRSAEEWKELSMSFGGNQYDIYAEMQRRYGNTMLLGKDVVGTDIVTIFHPEDIEKGLRKEGPQLHIVGDACVIQLRALGIPEAAWPMIIRNLGAEGPCDGGYEARSGLWDVEPLDDTVEQRWLDDRVRLCRGVRRRRKE